MKLIVDANLSPDWVEFLNLAGFEAAHWYSIGEKAALDIEIMSYAGQHGAILLTRDLDFGTLLVQLQAVRPSVV